MGSAVTAAVGALQSTQVAQADAEVAAVGALQSTQAAQADAEVAAALVDAP